MTDSNNPPTAALVSSAEGEMMRLKKAPFLNLIYLFPTVHVSLFFLLAHMNLLPMAGQCFGLWADCLTECRG